MEKITKDQYIAMKKFGYFDWELFYEYFIENNGVGDFPDFKGVIGGIWGQLTPIQQGAMINLMVEYFSKKFNIVKLFDKQEILIREW